MESDYYNSSNHDWGLVFGNVSNNSRHKPVKVFIGHPASITHLHAISNDQHRLHTAADIFRDRLLSDVEDESEMLRESSKRLESTRISLLR
jgi:hypothetical protein